MESSTLIKLKGKKILVIDNQYTEFKLIKDKLEEVEIEVYPRNEADFRRALDMVRVVLNGRYETSRKREAARLFKEYVGEIIPDLFIIDYKLSGCHDGLSGVELAIMLWGDPSYAETPIMFFTRAMSNDEQVIARRKTFETQYSQYQYASDWVQKGYAGMQLTTNHYFEKYVITKIERLILEGWQEMYASKIRDLCTHPFIAPYKDLLERVLKQAKEKGSMLPHHKEVINTLRQNRFRQKDALKELFSTIQIE